MYVDQVLEVDVAAGPAGVVRAILICEIKSFFTVSGCSTRLGRLKSSVYKVRRELVTVAVLP